MLGLFFVFPESTEAPVRLLLLLLKLSLLALVRRNAEFLVQVIVVLVLLYL